MKNRISLVAVIFLLSLSVLCFGQKDHMYIGSAHSSKVYEPFSSVVPSDQNNPAYSPIRKAMKTDGSDDGDDWTPSDWQGDNMQDPGEAMPIGSPLVMLVLAGFYAMFIAYRNHKKSNTMRKLSSVICILFLTGNGYATNHYFSNAGAGSKNGTSWDNAKSAGYLKATLDTASAGDKFYLKVGTYSTGCTHDDTNVMWWIKPGIEIYGGYPSSKTGTDVTINYDTLTHYSCFDGATYTGNRVQVYFAQENDGAGTKAWNSTEDTHSYTSVTANTIIKGVSFQDAPGRNTNGIYTGNGLLIKHAKVDFYHCCFLNNTTENSKRLAALVAWGSQVRCYDCIFRGNKTASSGAAFCIRQKNNGGNGQESYDENKKSVAVFERCEFDDNDAINGGYGGCGALGDNAGELYMINCTVTGSQATVGGAGIRVSTNCKAYFISNTFTNNTHTNSSANGEQVSIGTGASCYFVNNIMTKSNYNAVQANENNVGTSGGYNIIGGTNLTMSGTNDSKEASSNTQSAIFSSNTLSDNGGTSKTIVPASNRNTCTVTQLQDIVSVWSLPTVVTEKLRLDLDQRGYPRGAGNNGITTCGAYDFHANARFYCSDEKGKGAKNGFSWDDALPSDQLAYDLHNPGKITTFFAMAGNYSPAKVDGGADGNHWRIAPGITLKGGYPLESKGINTTIDYSTAERTVFSASGITQTGPFVQIGKDAGDASKDDTNTATGFSPVSFHGITFSDANWSATAHTGVMIFLKHARADFHYCSFLNNHNTGSNSGAAIQSWGSQLRCYDCVFRGNSGSTNVCIRQRARNDGISAGNEGFTLLERCELTDNTATGNWAGAIAVGGNSGSFAMFNCTLNGTRQNKGGAIRVDTGGRFYAAGCTFFNNYNTTTTPNDLGHGESFSCESSTTVKLANNIFVNANDNYSDQHPVISLNNSMTFESNGYNTFGTVKLEGQSLNVNDEYATSADNVNQYTVPAVFGRGKLANHGGVSLTISPAKSWDGNMTVTDLATAVNGWGITDLSGNAVTPEMTVDQRNIARNTTTVRGACEAGAQSGALFFSPSGAGDYSGDSWTNAGRASDLASMLQNAGYGVTFYLMKGSYANNGVGYVIPEGVIIRGGYPTTKTGTDTSIDYATLDPASDLSVFNAEQKNTDHPFVRIGIGSANKETDNYFYTDFAPCEIWGCQFTNAQRTTGGDYNGDMIYVKHARADFHYCMFDKNKAKLSGGFERKNGAITAWGSVVRCYDCTFNDNYSGGSGAAFVLRQHNSNVVAEHRSAYLSLGVFERCLFTDNIIHTDSAYGGTAAQADYAGTLVLINNTFRGGSCKRAGGALRVSTGDTLYAVSNTFYDNIATESNGDAISIGGNARVWLANNIILGKTNTDAKPAIQVQSGAVLKSEGYNVFGTVANTGTYTTNENDLSSQTQTQIFGGDNVALTTKGTRKTMVPTGTLKQPTLTQLTQIVHDWNLPEEATEHMQLDLDQIAHTRATTTRSGAYDANGGRRYRLVCRYDSKEYASNEVINNNDVISLYFHTGGTLQMQKRDGVWIDTLAALNAATIGMNKDTVYTVTFNSSTKQPNTGAAIYSGTYNVRIGEYNATSNAMTAFDPRGSVGYDGSDVSSYFNHYWYASMANGADATATVGNTYNNHLLSERITADKYTDSKGCLLRDSYVRYGYNPGTNILTRTLIDADMESNNEYLTVHGSKVYTDAGGTSEANEEKFTFMSDGLYQCDLYAKNGASIIVKLKYGTDDGYLFGLTGGTPNTHSVVIGSDGVVYALRFVYDFKENKFTESWLPSGSYDELALNADMFLIRQNNSNASQLTLSDADEDGATGITNITQAYFVLEIDRSAVSTNGPAYWFTLPYDCPISSIIGQSADLYGKSWVIQYYKGQARAINGWHETQTYWGYKSPTGTLKANEGYVLMIDPIRVEWGKTTTGADVLRLYFPTDGSKTYEVAQLTDQTTTVPTHTCAIVGREVKDSHWNIIGVPSLSDIKPNNVPSMDGDFPAYVYEWDWNSGAQRYTTTAINSEFTFKAFHGYMTQYAGTISWAEHANLQEASSAPRRAPSLHQQSTRLTLELMSDDQMLDRAYINLMSDATEGYDLNRDLSKIIDATLPQIWSVSANEEWAANNLPLSTKNVPLTISLPQAGTVTVQLSNTDAQTEVSLVDHLTGHIYDLSASPVEITLQAGTTAGRYELTMHRENTPTDLTTVSQDCDATSKILHKGQIYILRDGKIYTIWGGKIAQ